MKKNKKYIIIRQIPPEIQHNSWLDILDDEYFKDLIVTGNRDYTPKTTDLYDRIISLLDMGAETIEDVDYVFDELSKAKKNKIVKKYAKINVEREEKTFVLYILELVTGRKWQHGYLRGYSQGEYQECYAPVEIDIDYIEQVYFGKEDEYGISDLLDTIPEDINEANYIGWYFVAHSERNVKDVLIKAAKEFVPEWINIADVEVKIFIHDDFIKIPTYKELKE